MLKKNVRVKYGSRIGTVVENQYVVYEGKNRDAYCDVLFDSEEYLTAVKSELLEII